MRLCDYSQIDDCELIGSSLSWLTLFFLSMPSLKFLNPWTLVFCYWSYFASSSSSYHCSLPVPSLSLPLPLFNLRHFLILYLLPCSLPSSNSSSFLPFLLFSSNTPPIPPLYSLFFFLGDPPKKSESPLLPVPILVTEPYSDPSDPNNDPPSFSFSLPDDQPTR